MFHKVQLNLKDSPVVEGASLINAGDRVVMSPNAIGVETKLVK